MKKLIALFAVLVAMTSLSFAATDNATATVHVYTPCSVVVTVDGNTTSSIKNVLTGSQVTFTFFADITWDAAYTTGVSGSWSQGTTGTTSAYGEWSGMPTTSSSFNADNSFTLTYTAGSTGGGVSDSFVGVFTVDYVTF